MDPIENHMVVDACWPVEDDGSEACSECKMVPCQCDRAWDERE